MGAPSWHGSTGPSAATRCAGRGPIQPGAAEPDRARGRCAGPARDPWPGQPRFNACLSPAGQGSPPDDRRRVASVRRRSDPAPDAERTHMPGRCQALSIARRPLRQTRWWRHRPKEFRWPRDPPGHAYSTMCRSLSPPALRSRHSLRPRSAAATAAARVWRQSASCSASP